METLGSDKRLIPRLFLCTLNGQNINNKYNNNFMTNLLANAMVTEESGMSLAGFPLLLLPIIGLLSYYVILWIEVTRDTRSAPTLETKRIVILGHGKGCGKTTMWKLLRGEYTEEGKEDPTPYQEVKPFYLSAPSGKKVKIRKTVDYGGGDDWVRKWEEIIQSGTFVYFLVNLETIDKDKKDINQRLWKIVTIFKEKKLEKVGIKIVATHLDKTKYTESEAIEKVIKTVKIRCEGNHIIALNLFDKNAFQRIINEIVHSTQEGIAYE